MTTAGQRATKKALIVVRTYPVPAMKGVEVSCTAGITEQGEWIRLFPVPWRFLDDDKRFRKYQWIEANVSKARGDPRPESYTLDPDSIRILSTVGPENGWRARWDRLRPLTGTALCDVQQAQRADKSHKHPTLALIKPAEISRLLIKPTDPSWNTRQMAALNQTLLPFQRAVKQPLEKISFLFRYDFRCEVHGCRGHQMICTDWEMGQSYRRWQNEYGAQWEVKFRARYEDDMRAKFDTHFFVGTLHEHPNNWIIVGLFYPPKPAALPLFGA